MAKCIQEPPPKRDDPIFREGFTVFTPRSARGPKRPPTKSDEASETENTDKKEEL